MSTNSIVLTHWLINERPSLVRRFARMLGSEVAAGDLDSGESG